jgi:hypothetical protein
VVRAKDWTQDAIAPITKQDVDAVIATDSELAWSTTDYVEMKDETGGSTRYYAITWRGAACFWWFRDQVQCSDPDEVQVSKLLQIANKAHVVGDDGELYPLEHPATGPTDSAAQPAANRWPLWKQLLAALVAGTVLLALKLLIFGG